MVNRLSGDPVPGSYGFPLVADAHSGKLLPAYPGLFQHSLYRQLGILPDFLQIMLHPAFFVDNLAVGKIRPAKKLENKQEVISIDDTAIVRCNL